MQYEYREKIKELFIEWRKKTTVVIDGQEEQRVAFNEDGIVNPDSWFALPVDKRILFVLKETNDEKRGDWPLAEWLNSDNGTDYAIWRRTAEWTKGIMSANREMAVKTYSLLKGEAVKPQVRSIAVLNLKKSPGGSSANQKEIEAYTNADIELIKREIELIDPSIVIFGGTFWCFQQAYRKECFQMEPGLRYCYGMLAGKERLLIDYWHPANRFPALTSYYGITGIYQAALNSRR